MFKLIGTALFLIKHKIIKADLFYEEHIKHIEQGGVNYQLFPYFEDKTHILVLFCLSSLNCLKNND